MSGGQPDKVVRFFPLRAIPGPAGEPDGQFPSLRLSGVLCFAGVQEPKGNLRCGTDRRNASRRTGRDSSEALDGMTAKARGGSAHVAQVRGVLAERVAISTQLDPFLSLRALAI